MKLKTLLAALALSAAPSFGIAMCSGDSHQAMSCAEGTVWDSETNSCVQQVTG